MADVHPGYRVTFRSIGDGAGGCKFEIVDGKAFSVATHRHAPLPYPKGYADVSIWSPPPRPPPSRSRDKASAWCFSDPESKRKRRMVSYNAYGVEGKVKASIRRGLRWFKRKCSRMARHR